MIRCEKQSFWPKMTMVKNDKGNNLSGSEQFLLIFVVMNFVQFRFLFFGLIFAIFSCSFPGQIIIPHHNSSHEPM